MCESTLDIITRVDATRFRSVEILEVHHPQILCLVPGRCTTCVEMCESAMDIITRVDATSFRNLLLIISTLVVGESWKLAPLPIWR
jgi:hypothetical protein